MADRVWTVNMGAANTGLTMAYRVIGADLATLVARTTTGVSEIATGIYEVSVPWDDTWTGYILWDNGTLAAIDTFVGDLSADDLFPCAFAVNFGAAQTGLATVGYCIKNAAGVDIVARTVTGVSEAFTGSGIYLVIVSRDPSWVGRIDWDIATVVKATDPITAVPFDVPIVTSWPTPSDVENQLLTMGVTATISEKDVSRVISEFKLRTGRPQFFVDGAVEADYDVNPPDTRGGTAILYVNDFSAITGIVSNGRTLTESTDYWLTREIEGDSATPYISVSFNSACFGGPRSVTITGTPGYASIPDDVWMAVLERCVEQYLRNTGAEDWIATRKKLGDREIEFGGSGATRLDAYGANWEKVIDRYRRYL